MGTSVELLATADPEQEKEEDDVDTPIYEKYDHMLHGGSRTKKWDILTLNLISIKE